MQIAIVSLTALEGITNIVSSQETPGGGDSPRRKRDLSLLKKEKDTGCVRLAPPVAKSCSGRGNILWRACEYRVAADKSIGLLMATFDRPCVHGFVSFYIIRF